MKSWQQARLRGEALPPADFQRAAAAAARQAFFFVRDLAHQHYHHDRFSDLMTTTYVWSPADDELWRRETQYGLARMAISSRRRDTAASYKQALGLVAYAEAFQKHLCGWKLAEAGEPLRSSLAFMYDFAALRLSIDASLKVRELKDSHQLQGLLFAFGFCVTCLGIIVPGLRAPNPPKSAAHLTSAIALMTAHPLQTLLIAFTTANAINIVFRRTSSGGLRAWSGGLSRFADGVMGSAMWRKLSPRVSHIAGVTSVLVLLLFVVLAAGGAWFGGLALLSGGN